MDTRHFVLLVAGCLFPACLAAEDFLFFTSQGDAIHGPGVYGGAIDFRLNGKISEDMYMYGYNCVYKNKEDAADVEFDWFDIDEYSGNVLFRPYSEGGRLTLLRGPICHKRPHCRNHTQEALFDDFQLLPHKSVGAVAYHHSTVYFIYNDVSRPGNQKRLKIQLRKLAGCEDRYPVSSASTMSIESCSELVADIKDDIYTLAPHSRALDNIYVYGNRDNPSFLFLLQESEYSDTTRTRVDISLMHVSPDASVSTLHTHEVEDLSYFMLQLRGLGGVSVRGGHVCWAAIDSVLCGRLTASGNVKVTEVKEALSSAQVASVCEAEGEPMLAKLVTGVAIAEVDTELALYFGCVAQQKGFGGAGLMRMPNGASTGSVYPLADEEDKLFAGPMHITQHCHHHPSQEAIGAVGGGNIVRPTLWLAWLLPAFYYSQ